jgi:hypothetical protein
VRILTSRRAVRGAALAAVVPLALGTLAACGNGSDSSSTAADPAAPSSSSSSTTTSDASTAPGSKISGADFLALAKAAAGKLTTVKVTMVGDVSGQQYTMKGAMDMTGAKPAMDLTMDLSSSGMTGLEMRLVDGVMYMNMGQMTQNKFVKFDLSDPNSPLGDLSSSLDQLDPATMMGAMSADVFKNVSFVGTDSTGRHYRATLVTAKAPQVKGLPPTATASLPKTMKYDTWFDDQGRFSKFVVAVPQFMRMTATYSDYGVPVHVAAPPASQITSLPGTTGNG